ncbi:hypothetical protein CWI36_0001p0040 [Hamiltosporidium magnivora]|uniref:Spindle pole body component n=1 Tax=Hamiltosporidium magnivora TaxID=148818 RepID=A0A4Q9LNM9_9MICR|nr:hypothetical protein CWI36_0001p0040 [Hamiltosporidium magnivora]
MLRNTYYLFFLLYFVFSSRYHDDMNSHFFKRINENNDYRPMIEYNSEVLNSQNVISLKHPVKSESRDPDIFSYQEASSLSIGSIHETTRMLPSENRFSIHDEESYLISRNCLSAMKPISDRDEMIKETNNRYFPYNRKEIERKNRDYYSHNTHFSSVRKYTLDGYADSRRTEGHVCDLYSRPRRYDRDMRYKSHKNNKSVNKLHIMEDVSSRYTRFPKRYLDFESPFAFMKSPKAYIPQLELKNHRNTEVNHPRLRSFSRMIDTRGKNYAMLVRLQTEFIGFSDITFFVENDFSIDGYFLENEYHSFFDLIDHIFIMEKTFWSQFDSLTMLKYLSEKMHESLLKYDFCNINSPLLSYFPCLINVKYFLKNIIFEDINLVKSSCLWILLLKAANALCNVQPNRVPNDRINVGEVTVEKYKDFDVYNGDKASFCVLKRLYVVFYRIARKIFRLSNISREYISMLDYMFNNAMYRNKDIHISRGCHLNFSRVVADCMFRIDPKMISLFILGLEAQKIANIRDHDSLLDINCFLLRIFEGSCHLDIDVFSNFRLFYQNLIESYIDFFEIELLSLYVFRGNSIVKNQLNHIDLIVQILKSKAILLSRYRIETLMEISEALCVIFNHFIKVGLNYELYTKRYIEYSVNYCKGKIEALLRIIKI